jgi:hypothetical protein
MLNGLFFRLRSVLRPKTVESENGRRVAFSLRTLTRKLRERRREPWPISSAMRINFGGLEQVKEDCRDARGVSTVETVVQDLRHAWRTLLKSPVFAAGVFTYSGDWVRCGVALPVYLPSSASPTVCLLVMRHIVSGAYLYDLQSIEKLR